MKRSATLKLVQISLFTALTCVLTVFPSIKVPFSNGYIHLGDAVVIISVYFLGLSAAISASIGSMFADFFIGATVYAPATLVIKAAMAVCAYLIIKKKEKSLVSFIIASIVAETVMIMGYFLYEWILIGFETALASIVYGLIQGGGSVVFAFIVFFLLKDTLLKYFLKDSSLDKDKKSKDK